MTDVGRVRSENEDAFGAFPEHAEGDRLFVVADGMGGHVRGREASTTAVEVVQRTYFARAREAVPDRLARAFEDANRRVYDLACAEDGPSSMGTTGTALALCDGHAYVAHVGDSRAYRVTEAGMEQITRDHTMVEAMRREGLITDDEARTHPRRGALTRAIGVAEAVEVDVADLGAPREGDRFLLCTDGLAEIPATEVRRIVLHNPPQDACARLVDEANARGGLDNATALIVCIACAEG
jgi:protein phosphatase